VKSIKIAGAIILGMGLITKLVGKIISIFHSLIDLK